MAYDLCDTDEVKAALEITSTDYDDLIATCITQASGAIAQRYQREFIGPAGGTRYFKARGRYIDLAPYDLRSASSVVLNPEESSPGTLTANSDYVLQPLGGAPLGGSYQTLTLSPRITFTSTLAQEFGFAQVRIIGDWGCFSDASSLADDVKRAAVVTVSSWLDRGMDAYASGVDGGREIRPDQSPTFAIPASAHALLSPWARIGTI